MADDYDDYETLRDRYDSILLERNELLAACKEFVVTYDGDLYEVGMWPMMDRARAAIAKVEGK